MGTDEKTTITAKLSTTSAPQRVLFKFHSKVPHGLIDMIRRMIERGEVEVELVAA